MQNEIPGGNQFLTQHSLLLEKKLKDLSFLVCESEHQSQRLLKNWISLQGAYVSMVTSLDEVVEKMTSRKYDLILIEFREIHTQPKNAVQLIREKGFSGLVCAIVPQVFAEFAQHLEQDGYARCFSATAEPNFIVDELANFIQKKHESDIADVNEEGIISTHISNPVVRRVLKNFIDGLSGRFSQLSNALQQSDWRSVETVAHSLRGTAGNFGYPQIMEVCTHIETTVRSDRRVDLDDVTKLQRLLERAKAGYELYVAQTN